eukprot:569167-Prymnesium_polylepis.1
MRMLSRSPVCIDEPAWAVAVSRDIVARSLTVPSGYNSALKSTVAMKECGLSFQIAFHLIHQVVTTSPPRATPSRGM